MTIIEATKLLKESGGYIKRKGFIGKIILTNGDYFRESIQSETLWEISFLASDILAEDWEYYNESI